MLIKCSDSLPVVSEEAVWGPVMPTDIRETEERNL